MKTHRKEHMVTTSNVVIDVTLIPNHVRMDLLSIPVKEIPEWFKQPGVQEAFEKWKAERAEKEAANAAGKE